MVQVACSNATKMRAAIIPRTVYKRTSDKLNNDGESEESSILARREIEEKFTFGQPNYVHIYMLFIG